ncbi:hypothetical protein KR009_006928 [Drosophila setifemur]|nr:hypothetical protein KR009_006928 [Drosophila setifemur]
MAWFIALLIPLLLAAMVDGNPTDVDCSRRQDISLEKGCCAYPTLRFEQFRKYCGRLMPVGAPRVSPCLYECIFNATNVLVDSELDPVNTRTMLEMLLGSNHDFLEAYMEGMLHCKDTVEDMLLKKRPRYQSGPEMCSPVAVFYGICTQRYVFNNCPSSSWTGSEVCEMARWRNLNCPSARSSRGSSSRNR